MPKCQYRNRESGQAGMTLIEVMVSAGLVGLIFTALMFLLFQSGKFGGKTTQTLETIEGAAEAVSMFSSVLPEVTRIQSCLCRGNSNSRASCIWDPLNSPWYDPVITGGATNPVTLLSGEFEAFDGNIASPFNSLSSLSTNSISMPGQSCAAVHSTMSSTYQLGCKLSFGLVYSAPTAASGSTPSNAGQLTLNMGTGRSASIGNFSPGGAKNIGITELGCGFDVGSSGTAVGSVFVLNLKLKAKANLVQTTSSPQYESWFPDATCSNGYCKGTFREIQLKFTMRNLIQRGVYFWKPESIRNCKIVGANAGSPTECCSQAWDGSRCITCIAANNAGGVPASCCSGRTASGNCL